MLLLCNYYVTYHCNARCGFCHFGLQMENKSTPQAALEDFRSNISQLAKLGVSFVDLTGGEPLLNKHIAEMAEFARRKKMQTSITTNTILYPKYAEALAGKVSLLHFSLDSPDEEEHNRLRGVNCYKKVFESIHIAKALGEFPDILFTVTNENVNRLDEMYDIAQYHELVLIINPVFTYFGNPGLSIESLDKVEKFREGKKGIYLNDAYIRLRRKGGNDVDNPLCKAVSRTIVISPMNEIMLPCYHFAQEHIPIDRPLKELLKNDRIKYYRRNEGRFDFCKGCTVNCYFEPSFAFPSNTYGFLSLSSKFKYGYHKLVKQKLKKKWG